MEIKTLMEKKMSVVTVIRIIRNMQEDILRDILYNDLNKDRLHEFADSSTPCNSKEILELSLEFNDWFRETISDDTILKHLEKNINNLFLEKAFSFFCRVKEKLNELNEIFEEEKECKDKENFKKIINEKIDEIFENIEFNKIVKKYYSYRIIDFFDELEN